MYLFKFLYINFQVLLNTENTEKKQEGYTKEEKGAFGDEDDIEYIVGSLGLVPPKDDDYDDE